jgi:hypothetical protein
LFYEYNRYISRYVCSRSTIDISLEMFALGVL